MGSEMCIRDSSDSDDEDENPPAKPEQRYDLKDIDRERIALDARLWTKREYGNQFKRTDPSVYDLFEALQIRKNLTLEAALTELIGRLTARKLQEPHKWEPSIYTFYGTKLGRTRTDIWESALVHCLRGSTACLLYTSPSPRDRTRSRMPSSA